MKKLIIAVTAIFLIFFTMSDDENTLTARKIVKDFGTQLKGELIKGMKKGGQIEAISVCYQKAPKIAKEISDSTGWEVARTSLKTRNSDNVPDEWERTVLEVFEEQLKDGKDIKTMEYSEIVKKGDGEYFRYMKAIPTGSVCLNCHGSNIKEPIKTKINELYKNDKAVNYKKGDIRGAFTLSKKLK